MGMNLMLFSCSSSNEQEAETLPTPQLVFLFSPGGLGDMSYNDRILEGVQQFKMDYPQVDLYLYSPASLEEAEKIFSDWIQKPGQHTPALFTLAGYKNLYVCESRRKTVGRKRTHLQQEGTPV